VSHHGRVGDLVRTINSQDYPLIYGALSWASSSATPHPFQRNLANDFRSENATHFVAVTGDNGTQWEAVDEVMVIGPPVPCLIRGAD
jgi:hypothetical protein